jgi:hypothetical protein
MSQLINQPNLFSPDHADSRAGTDAARLPAEPPNVSRLSPGLTLLIIAPISAILWVGIFLLAGRVSDLVQHLT